MMLLLETIEKAIAAFSSRIDWVTLILLIGGGLFFLIHSRFTPFLYFRHAIRILSGTYDKDKVPGQLSHFQALSSAIAATVGMGNISGVAIALVVGGPGAIFWMWISALIGMATKFYTCSLAVMYRSQSEKGTVQSGPMYTITNGLGKKWKPLAIFFALAGLIGTLPAFTANQLTQTLVDVMHFKDSDKMYIGIVLAIITSFVILGGIKRIGLVASKLVPFMVVLYFIIVLTILVLQIDKVPAIFMMIFSDAFSGDAAAGGALGYLIKTGVKRAAFSNEAGIGTAPMMHGTAKTNEPIREGLVAMLGPAIDTLLVCTLTALAILSTGVVQNSDKTGISLTLEAFNSVLPYGIGDVVVVIMVLIFAFSTLFSYSYYGVICLGFLTKPAYGKYYNYFYIGSIIVAAMVKIEFVLNLIDSAFALMAIPTMLSGVLLSGKVHSSAKTYFEQYHKNKMS
ncbi:sodium:alanine symporter family protein [Aquimarina addita]|uniref:Sodium:alanine symporter family protein n=1 Tax=Aquimarina addita TaxID=870485 RepID=A0ABP6UPL6_9FLAO